MQTLVGADEHHGIFLLERRHLFTDLLNDQINKELYSAYLYLDMSTFYLGKHLYGFASWFKKQAVEETEHADKMISYLAQEGAPVELKDVAHAGKSYKDLKEPLAFQLEHEMYVTSLINKIYDAADEANDRRTAHFLDWFIDEQTEEEKTAAMLLEKFNLLAGDNRGLYELDAELGKR